MSRAKDITEKLNKLREQSQIIDPLVISKTDKDPIGSTRLWIEKVWKNRDKQTGINIVKVDTALGIYKIERAKVNKKRVNLVFQMINNECTFFTRYFITQNLKGLPSKSITQILLWRNLDKADYSIDSFYITKNVLFPMTNSLLCDTQQTRLGIKAWDFIVYQFLDVGCKCGIYDNVDKILIPVKDYAEYKTVIGNYRGTGSAFIRYQVCVYKI